MLLSWGSLAPWERVAMFGDIFGARTWGAIHCTQCVESKDAGAQGGPSPSRNAPKHRDTPWTRVAASPRLSNKLWDCFVFVQLSWTFSSMCRGRPLPSLTLDSAGSSLRTSGSVHTPPTPSPSLGSSEADLRPRVVYLEGVLYASSKDKGFLRA